MYYLVFHEMYQLLLNTFLVRATVKRVLDRSVDKRNANINYTTFMITLICLKGHK